MNALPPVLDEDGLAALLLFPSSRAAGEWARKVALPRVRVAGRVLYRSPTVLAWLEEHEEAPETEEQREARVAAIADGLRPRKRRA